MFLAKLSTKGQLVIPRPLRAWPTGTEFSVSRAGSGLQLAPVTHVPSVSIETGFGVLADKLGRPRRARGAEEAALLDAILAADDATRTARRRAPRRR